MKSLQRMSKLADTFEAKLEKFAQEDQTDVYAFQQWMDQNFTSVDKNKIANTIANSIEEDLQSLYVTLVVKMKKLEVEALVNGKPNDNAKKIVYNSVFPKVSKVLNSFPEGSKYSGWIKYPK